MYLLSIYHTSNPHKLTAAFPQDLTIADLHHLPTDELLPLIGLDTLDNPAHPSVARWWNEIRSRPAWKAVKEGFSSVEKYD